MLQPLRRTDPSYTTPERSAVVSRLKKAILEGCGDVVVIRDPEALKGGLIGELMSSPQLSGFTFVRRNGSILNEAMLADLWSRRLVQASHAVGARPVVLVINNAEALAESALSNLWQTLSDPEHLQRRPRVLLIGTPLLLERLRGSCADERATAFDVIIAAGFAGEPEPKLEPKTESADFALPPALTPIDPPGAEPARVVMEPAQQPVAGLVGPDADRFETPELSALTPAPGPDRISAPLRVNLTQTRPNRATDPTRKPTARVASIAVLAVLIVGALATSIWAGLDGRFSDSSDEGMLATASTAGADQPGLPAVSLHQRPASVVRRNLDLPSAQLAGPVADGAADTPRPATADSNAPLLLIAEPGETLTDLYVRVYRDFARPLPYFEFLAANPDGLKPGMRVRFPPPPGGWHAATAGVAGQPR